MSGSFSFLASPQGRIKCALIQPVLVEVYFLIFQEIYADGVLTAEHCQNEGLRGQRITEQSIMAYPNNYSNPVSACTTAKGQKEEYRLISLISQIFM